MNSTPALLRLLRYHAALIAGAGGLRKSKSLFVCQEEWK